MIGAENEAHHVRHHDANKTDDACKRHGHRSDQRYNDQQNVFRPHYVDTQMQSGFLALQHQIEFARLSVKNRGN